LLFFYDHHIENYLSSVLFIPSNFRLQKYEKADETPMLSTFFVHLHGFRQ